MNKNVVVLGGGTGQSVLLSGLKKFPVNITAVVSVADDGRNTGKLREQFNIPAMGDVRRVLIALSETEEFVSELFSYRFKTDSDLNGNNIGNLLLTAMSDICGNLSSGVKEISKILNLKGEVLPLTDDNVVLMGEMEDGTFIEGEHNVTLSPLKIKRVFYKEEPRVNEEVIDKIKKSDAIILSMGSVYTSIIPNLLCDEVIQAIDSSNAKIIYVCNVMTQPGETDDFKVSDHINLLNSYLGNKKIDVVITNNGEISHETQMIYETTEQKDLVIIDDDNIKIENVSKPLIRVENNVIRHDNLKLALEIINILSK
mgnify:CR=1 FL=1